MMKYIVALFFFGFAAVHGGYERTPYQPGTLSYWNSVYGKSWLLNGIGLSEAAVRPIAQLLWVLPMAGFLAAGLALLGWFVPSAWWRPLVIASAGGSVLLAVLFWHPMQWLSALADLAILAVMLGTEWTLRITG